MCHLQRYSVVHLGHSKSFIQLKFNFNSTWIIHSTWSQFEFTMNHSYIWIQHESFIQLKFNFNSTWIIHSTWSQFEFNMNHSFNLKSIWIQHESFIHLNSTRIIHITWIQFEIFYNCTTTVNHFNHLAWKLVKFQNLRIASIPRRDHCNCQDRTSFETDSWIPSSTVMLSRGHPTFLLRLQLSEIDCRSSPQPNNLPGTQLSAFNSRNTKVINVKIQGGNFDPLSHLISLPISPNCNFHMYFVKKMSVLGQSSINL